MKGISLAIETVIVIILAVLVLVSVLALFADIWLPGVREIIFGGRQADLCGKYTLLDPECSDYASVNSVNSGIVGNLTEVCKVLAYNGCDSDIQKCVQNCCKSWCKK